MRGGDSSDDSSSEDEERKIVKSVKDKKFEEIQTHTDNIKLNLENNNWNAVQNEYDKLTKAVQKGNNIIRREGVPTFLTAILVELDDKIKSVTNQDVRKMNKLNARSFNALKQGIKKFSKQYENEIKKYRSGATQVQATKEEKTEEKTKEVKVLDETESFTVIGKGGKEIQINSENLFEKLAEIVNTRGKKGTNKNEQSSTLVKMLKISKTPYQKIKVLLVLIPFQFDYVSGIGNSLNNEIWTTVTNYIKELLELLENNPQIVVKETASDEKTAEEIEQLLADGEQIVVSGSVNSFIDRIDEEFTRSLQNIDPHTTEYIERMKDEQLLYELIVRAQIYLERIQLSDKIPSIIIRRIEHIYYKPVNVISILEENIRNNEVIAKTEKIDPEKLVYELCVKIYKQDDERLRSRALLYHIYHDALHDRFTSARDLLLMSHIQEHVNNTDVNTQIIYNRAIVQLGLSAFRSGMIRESNQCLQEIQNGQKVKELLAQGIQSRYGDKTPEQEKLEKQRQLPFHMHINIELLECIYLTCSMLLEIPNMAENVYNVRKKVISKNFRKLLDSSERQTLLGPPENTREHIMGASKALASGEWEKCRDLITSIKIWDLMPNTEEIKKMLTRKIQEEGLRTWIFTCRNHYDNISLDQLAKMFDLPVSDVHSIICRMIIKEELSASIDESKSIVVMSKSEENKLHFLAQQYYEKLSKFVETNENLAEQRTQENNKRNEKDQKGYQNQNNRNHNNRANRNYPNKNERNQRNNQRKNNY